MNERKRLNKNTNKQYVQDFDLKFNKIKNIANILNDKK
jgi:hypothetical protein